MNIIKKQLVLTGREIMLQTLKEFIKRNKKIYNFLLKCYRCICYIGGAKV